jgi:hypothetical protein
MTECRSSSILPTGPVSLGEALGRSGISAASVAGGDAADPARGSAGEQLENNGPELLKPIDLA